MKKFLFISSLLLTIYCIPAIVNADTATPGVATAAITAPPNGSIVSGGKVDISIKFDSNSAQPVTKVEVFLDGQQITERTYDSPSASGNCMFRWDTTRTPNGKHRLDIPIFSNGDFLAMSTCVVTVKNDGGVKPMAQVGLKAAIKSPKDGDVVSGVTSIVVEASAAGSEPFISVYVDGNMKSVSNRGPYVYDWDTTTVNNGPHVVGVNAMDDSDNKLNLRPVKVTVRNPIKRTPLNAQSTPITVEQTQVPSTAPSSSTPVAKAVTSVEKARTTSPASETFEAPQAPMAIPPALSMPMPVTAQAAPSQTVPASKPVSAPSPAPAKPESVEASIPKPVVMASANLPSETSVSSVLKSDSKLEVPAAPAVTAHPSAPTSAIAQVNPKMAEVSEVVPGTSGITKSDSNLIAPALPHAVAVKSKSSAPLSVASAPKVKPIQMAKLPSNHLPDPIMKADSKPMVPAIKKVAVKPSMKVASIKTAKPELVWKNVVTEKNGIKMVGVRPIFQKAGGKVYWNKDEQCVRAVDKTNDVRFKIGKDHVLVNAQKVQIDGKTEIKDGRTLVPESLVTGRLGMKLGDSEVRTASK